MPMRGEISLRPQPRTAEPLKLNWCPFVELNNDPDFVVVSSFSLAGLSATLWLATKLPLAVMMTGLIG